MLARTEAKVPRIIDNKDQKLIIDFQTKAVEHITSGRKLRGVSETAWLDRLAPCIQCPTVFLVVHTKLSDRIPRYIEQDGGCDCKGRVNKH